MQQSMWLRVALPLLFLSAALGGPTSERLNVGFGYVPPLSFRDSSGRAAGFTVDVLNEAARREQVVLNWIGAGTSRQSEQSLAGGKLDLLPAAMVTSERQRIFYLSEPWWFAELSLFTLAENSVRVASDLSGANLGLASPIYRETAARAFPRAVLVPFVMAEDAAEAVCRGEIDAALITHGDVHDIFLRQPRDCRGTDLRTFDTEATIELAVMARPERAEVARRLRQRIDEMALDGTLAALAARHPPIPTSGAVRLANTLQVRYQRRAWRTLLVSLSLLLAVSAVFILRQRQTQKRLSHDRELLERVIETIPVMIAISDPHLKQVKVNREFEDVLGWSSGDVPATYFSDRVGDGWQDVKVPAKNGGVVDSSWANIRLSDGTLVGIGIDLRDRIQVEQRLQQMQKMESIGLLAGGIAHDFNNLLAAILGNASLIEDEASPAVRSSVDSIIQAVNRAADLTRQLLSYAGKARLRLEPVDVSGVVRETADLLHSSVRKKVELQLRLDPELPAVDGDRSQIQQIVMNLVINAAEAVGERRGAVTVATGVSEVPENGVTDDLTGGSLAADRYVCIEVRDTGGGMDAETRARIFEPFFTTKFTGRGLGLAAVAGAVKAHRGGIQVLSMPGAGSTFRVFLPAGNEVERRSAPTRAEDLHGIGTVLVVDDEAMLRDFARSALRRFGYRVLEAGNGDEALRVLERNGGPVDLVLLDLTMPVMGGDEIIGQLRSRWPTIRIILMSGAGEDALERLAGQGAAALLHKPFTAAQLAEQVKRVLQDQTAWEQSA